MQAGARRGHPSAPCCAPGLQARYAHSGLTLVVVGGAGVARHDEHLEQRGATCAGDKFAASDKKSAGARDAPAVHGGDPGATHQAGVSLLACRQDSQDFGRDGGGAPHRHAARQDGRQPWSACSLHLDAAARCCCCPTAPFPRCSFWPLAAETLLGRKHSMNAEALMCKVCFTATVQLLPCRSSSRTQSNHILPCADRSHLARIGGASRALTLAAAAPAAETKAGARAVVRLAATCGPPPACRAAHGALKHSSTPDAHSCIPSKRRIAVAEDAPLPR